MRKKRPGLVSLLSASLVRLSGLAACGLRRADRRRPRDHAAGLRPGGSQRASHGKPSAATVSILHRFDLDRLAARQPDEAVRQLHEKALATGERDLLFALSELSYVAGDQIRRSVKPWDLRDARDYYLGSAVYAWLFLFGEGEEAPPGFLDPRLREACDFYNYGLGLALTEGRAPMPVVRLQEGGAVCLWDRSN